MGFFETLPVFQGFFCQCKRLLQSCRYYSGFWSRGTWPSAESPDRGPRRNAHYVRSKVERSRACAPLTKKPVWDSGFFAHALFVPKTPNITGFSGSVNGTTKNPSFLDFGFCQCKWAFCALTLPLMQNRCFSCLIPLPPSQTNRGQRSDWGWGGYSGFWIPNFCHACNVS